MIKEGIMNLENRLSKEQIKEKKQQFKKIFMYRVCGTGMGACACLLKESGFLVEGGDIKFEPPMSTYLKKTGIALHDLKNINREFLQNFDLIVVGNVVPKNSEDAQLIESSGVAFTSFPAALGGLILHEQNVVGLAGTHGKTTTTYLMAQIFQNLGHEPGYFIGGVLEEGPSSKLGKGNYFFIESDEYDSGYFEKISKLRLYECDHMVLTSLEFDHADIFKNIEDIKEQFRPALRELKGSLIYDETYIAGRELIDEVRDQKSLRRVSSYGLGTENGPEIIETGEQGTKFLLSYNKKKEIFQTNLVGKHNILNLSSCLIYCDHEGVELSKAQAAIGQLKLVKRRQEVRGKLGEAVVIDDFAHHPKAVELTLDGIRVKYPKHKLTVIFEPHSATARSSLFQDEFTNALSVADHVYITKPLRPTSVSFAKDLDIRKCVLDLESKGKTSAVVENLEQIMARLEAHQKRDDVIVILSNGTCLGFWESNVLR